MPKIPDDKPLPCYLQDLLNRCKQLTAQQKTQIKSDLRIHHDVFAKDSTCFGRCPWIKLTIHTGDAKPIKQLPRLIPLHY